MSPGVFLCMGLEESRRKKEAKRLKQTVNKDFVGHRTQQIPVPFWIRSQDWTSRTQTKLQSTYSCRTEVTTIIQSVYTCSFDVFDFNKTRQFGEKQTNRAAAWTVWQPHLQCEAAVREKLRILVSLFPLQAFWFITGKAQVQLTTLTMAQLH